MLRQIIFIMFFLTSCAFFDAMKEGMPLSKEDKIILEEFYHKGKIKRESFVCHSESNYGQAYCGLYQTIRNLCLQEKIAQSSCESYSLGSLLCMSLNSRIGFCGNVSSAQALCMLSGKSRLVCEDVDFKKALCIYEGGSLTYCDSLMKRNQFEDELLKDIKERRRQKSQVQK